MVAVFVLWAVFLKQSLAVIRENKDEPAKNDDADNKHRADECQDRGQVTASSRRRYTVVIWLSFSYPCNHTSDERAHTKNE